MFSSLSKKNLVILQTFVICKCFYVEQVKDFVVRLTDNPFLNNKILDLSKLRQIADDILKFIWNGK